ncbi:zinc finger CCCH domain-containing protein 41 [Ricinus communis]|uniref:zinc finger CCCH domain-containing protein 41 n=1 Tax=Ricinus communis TaxID=3988 RepID=UPI00201B259E|nr:zinc finger CCCH domain-containing protein 41 [Ricinus communis]
MELKVASVKPGGLSPSDCASDPEEKEISDEDDDDRNHKHRRRETRSQSTERDSLEPIFTRSYRKRNKPFENGHPFRENESQGSETWKNSNIAPLEKDFIKFDKRRPGMASFPRMNVDLNQRIRSNQIFFGEPGPGRGRGRDSGSWNQRDSRFSSVDIASQMVQQGSITPGLFAGRGLPNVSNTQNSSWNTFGLIPGIPSGGLDTLHPIGLQGTLRPAVNSSLNIGIPRQRCRDFEERGFCLRGDMCPMEHGINRIVVEDVQSLSQFNLPVSLPSAPLVGTPAGPGALQSVGASSTTLMNSKGLHSRNSKSGMVDDGMGFNGAYSVSAAGSGADLYDPDQPLWNTNGPETSSGLLALHSSKNDETESFMSVGTSDHHHGRLRDNADNECGMRNTAIPDGSQTTSSSVWGRVGSVKNRLDMKEKTDLTVSTSDYLENETKEDQDALANIQGTSRQGKRMISEDSGPKTLDFSTKTQGDSMRNTRKSSQKALCTLFVSGIPQKNNKRDSLLSHFQKFGLVIDIYIPSNSERAFVQFSRREEAEAALRAPDAVMGNRFIKLWWANRDSIRGDGISSCQSISATPCGVPGASVPPQPFIANRGKDNLQSAASKGATVPPPDASLPPTDHPKPVITNGPKVPPPLQKKLELEQLKEELRKKQELLAQKRNDFRRQLDKLEKQATGVKGEVVVEPAAKRHRVGMATDIVKVPTLRSSGHVLGVPSPRGENKSFENPMSSSPKNNASLMQQETTGSRQPIRPVGPAGAPFSVNRFKLDNRQIYGGCVDVLKEHFSSYGDLSTVELEDAEACDDNDGSEVPKKSCSALLTYATRRSAERAFLNGKCWQGKDLQFMWVTCSTSASDLSGRENISSASKCPIETGVQPAGKIDHMDSQEASASGNGEPEASERNSSDDHEVSTPCPTLVPSENESSKCDASAMSMSSKEESLKSEIGPTAISEEKESPTSGAY